MSYLNAHLSFSSAVPALVTSIAKRNSLKSINPFLSVSKVLKTWSQNCSAFPLGKNILYMSTNFTGVSLPLGQSCLKPLYHSLIVFSSYLVWAFKNSRSSPLKPCLLLMHPIVIVMVFYYNDVTVKIIINVLKTCALLFTP